MKSLTQIELPNDPTTNLQAATKQLVDGKEDAFSKGDIIAGANMSATGTLTDRLVGAGNITLSADIDRGVDDQSSNYTITATGVWENTGTSFTIVEDGVYLLIATVSGAVSANSTSGGIKARLYDATAGTAVDNTETTIVGAYTANTTCVGNGSLMTVALISGGTTINLQAQRTAGLGLSYTVSTILGAASFGTKLIYLRLA